MGVILDYANVKLNMIKFKLKVEAANAIFCDTAAQKMEMYAKTNRKWRDRTGNARQRLNGSWRKVDGGYAIRIAHGVDYGAWLEFAKERKYAILLPTVENVGRNEILPAYKNFLDKISLQ